MTAAATTGSPAVLKDEPGTRVERIGAGESAVVRKTYSNRGLRLLQTLWRRSRARREFDNLAAVAAAGIRCTDPVEWHERRRLGCVPSSTLVTRFVADCRTLKAVFAELSPGRDGATRRTLVAAMGRILAALHAAGIAWCTPMPRNFLLQGPADRATLYVCDVPAAIRTTAPLPVGLRDLDLWDAVLSPSRCRDFTRSERLRYLLAACDGDRARARAAWQRLAHRSPSAHRLHKNLVMAWRTYILGPLRRSATNPGAAAR